MFSLVRLLLILLPLGMFACVTARADPIMLSHDEGRAFHYVGRLNIAGSRFCTATLITEELVVTAAHCLYNSRTRNRVSDSMMHFVAGLNRGAHAAARRIRSSHVLPEYRFDGRVSLSTLSADVAVLVLERPINADDVRPVSISPAEPLSGPFSLVSYSSGRPHAPSIQTDAEIISRRGNIMLMNLAVTFGASGSPILDGSGNEKRLIGIVSASSNSNGRRIALTVPIEQAVKRLMIDIRS